MRVPYELGFPLWVRLTHWFNVLFLTLLVRSGIEILAAHPKLCSLSLGAVAPHTMKPRTVGRCGRVALDRTVLG